MVKPPPTEEGFAARWSRLKREPEAIEAQEDSPIVSLESDTTEPTDIARTEPTDEELLTQLELPDPEAMKAGDDFSAFMKEAVPDHLRRRALRVLWGSNPILANLDELVDYGEDYTDAATVIENMQTIYRVGKGSAWKFQEEQERIAAEKVAEEIEAAERRAHNGEPEEDIALADAEPDIEPEEDILTEPEEDAEEYAIASVSEDEQELAPPLVNRPRPMRFEFE